MSTAIFLNKIGPGTHSDPKFGEREREVLVTSIPGKKFQNAILASVLLRENF
jgi:hypothetical protein